MVIKFGSASPLPALDSSMGLQNSAPSFANLVICQMWINDCSDLAKDDVSSQLSAPSSYPHTGLIPFKEPQMVDSALS